MNLEASSGINNMGRLTDQLNKTNQPQKEYSGIGSSVVNFGKDIAQTAYLKLGGQNEINKLIQQNLDSGDKLFQLAQKQTDKNKKKDLLLKAKTAYDAVEGINNDILGKIRTNKQIISDALGTLGTVMIAGTPAVKGASGVLSKAVSTPLSRIAMGTAVGAGVGVQQALQKEATGKEIVKETIKGGAIGLVTSGILEGVGLGLKKVAEWKNKIKGETYIRELQPKTQELATELQHNWETTGQKIAEATDNNGKPLYVGNLKEIRGIARNETSTNSSELLNLLKNPEYKDIYTTRGDYNILKLKMEEQYGVLNDLQEKTIERELAKLPTKMDLPMMLRQKRIVDSQINPNFFIDPDSQRSFLGNVQYMLRGLLKEQIEYGALGSTNENIVKELNNKIGLAMDVNKMASLVEATKLKDKVGNGFYALLAKLMEKTIFNPAVTTRLAQMGTKAPQGAIPIRQAIINQLVKIIK